MGGREFVEKAGGVVGGGQGTGGGMGAVFRITRDACGISHFYPYFSRWDGIANVGYPTFRGLILLMTTTYSGWGAALFPGGRECGIYSSSRYSLKRGVGAAAVSAVPVGRMVRPCVIMCQPLWHACDSSTPMPSHPGPNQTPSLTQCRLRPFRALKCSPHSSSTGRQAR